MGRTLRPGNHVMGYDLRFVNMSGIDSDSMEKIELDAIFVRKVFRRNKSRKWDVLRLPRNMQDGEARIDDAADMEAMRQDLEEDPELRRGVNMYRQDDEAKTKSAAAREGDAEAAKAADGEEDEEEAPEVPLAELLEGLTLTEEHGPLGA